MSGNVQAGVLQIGLALGLLYAFWSGALAVLIEGLAAVIRGGEKPGSLFEAATAGARAGRSAGGAGGGVVR